MSDQESDFLHETISIDELISEGSVNAREIVDILAQRKDGENDYICVAQLVQIAKRIINEDNLFYAEIMKKDIEVDWELPAHQLQKSVTKQKGGIAAELGCKLGAFTPPEIKIMLGNWKELCKTFNIPDNPKSLARWKSEITTMHYDSKKEIARRQITKWLARGLNRTLYQVFMAFVKYHTIYRTGSYNEMEKEVMKLFAEWIKENGGMKKAKDLNIMRLLSILLCRDKRGIQLFHTELLTENGEKIEYEPRKWTLQRATNLVLVMMKVSRFDNINQLRERTFLPDFWKKVASKLNNETPKALRLFWLRKLYVMLFAEEEVLTSRVRDRLKDIIGSMRYRYWQEIDMKAVCQRFPVGYTPRFLQVMLSNAVLSSWSGGRVAAKVRERSKIKYLLRNMLDSTTMPFDMKLRRVKMSPNGMLDFID